MLTHDVELAIHAARFLEYGHANILSRLLEALLEIPRQEFDWGAASSLSRLPFQLEHEHLLRKLLARGERFAEPAIASLASVLGRKFKSELMDLALVRDTADEVARAASVQLAEFIEQVDIPIVVEYARSIELKPNDDDESDAARLLRIPARALVKLPISTLREHFFATLGQGLNNDESVAAMLKDVLVDIQIYRDRTRDAVMLPEVFALANDLIIKGYHRASFPAYLMVSSDLTPRHLSMQQVDGRYLATVIGFIEHGDKWAADLLGALSEHDQRIAKQIGDLVANYNGLFGDILRHLVTKDDAHIFLALENIASSSDQQSLSPFALLDLEDLDWKGKGELWLRLLKRKDPVLAKLMLGGRIPVEVTGLEHINMGEPEPWLAWMLALRQDKQDWWLFRQIANLLGRSSFPENGKRLLSHMEDSESPFRRIISRNILPYVSTPTAEEFSEKVVDYLLSELEEYDLEQGFEGNALAASASESFIAERLIPSAVGKSARFRSNLKYILKEAGKRLGLRFFLPAD